MPSLLKKMIAGNDEALPWKTHPRNTAPLTAISTRALVGADSQSESGSCFTGCVMAAFAAT
jgi:hypothetical protein